VNHGIRLYRLVTATWFTLLVAALCLAAIGLTNVALACAVGIVLLILLQTLVFRCMTCGARPGLWLLAIWTLLLDHELYIADVILLRRCPKCETVFTAAEPETSG